MSHTLSSPASAALPSLLPTHLQLPEGVPYDQLTEEENIWFWVSDGFTGYADTSQKLTAAPLQTHVGDHKGQWGRKVQGTMLFNWLLFTEGAMAGSSMAIHKHWLAVHSDNQSLGRNKTGGLVTGNSREESVNGSPRMCSENENICVPLNARQKAIIMWTNDLFNGC